MLFLAGAPEDPDLECLARCAQASGRPVLRAALDRQAPSAFTFEPGTGRLLMGGGAVRCSSAFIRPAFQGGASGDQVCAAAWFATFWAWLAGSPGIRIFNREMAWASANKALVLRLASDCGLAVPSTLVTNDLGRIRANRPEWAVKPLDGGGYCRSWTDLAPAHPEGSARLPAIFQEPLEYPELRIFVVEGRSFAYEVRSSLLDYRRDPAALVRPHAAVPGEIERGLSRLMERLGLDFAAADFKYSPEQARPVFLEINTCPMFAAFDALDEGRLASAILAALGSQPRLGRATPGCP